MHSSHRTVHVNIEQLNIPTAVAYSQCQFVDARKSSGDGKGEGKCDVSGS